MNLKEKWKRFWTLDVHNHEGFTLVELIIVIAILAILSTGAIAGYSVYVERANKAADDALISEINMAFRAACLENYLDVFDVEDAAITITDGVIGALTKAKVNGVNHADIVADFVTYFPATNAKLKYYSTLTFDATLHQFEGSNSNFAGEGVMDEMRLTLDGISDYFARGLNMGLTGDALKLWLTEGMNEDLIEGLGLNGMLDGYNAAMEITDAELDVILAAKIAGYDTLSEDQKNEHRLTYKANLGLMYFAEDAAARDFDDVMSGVDNFMNIMLAAKYGVESVSNEQLEAYYLSVASPDDVKEYDDASPTRKKELLDIFRNDPEAIALSEDLKYSGVEAAAMAQAAAGMKNDGGVSTLGSMYALAAGYYNSSYYNPETDGAKPNSYGDFDCITKAMENESFYLYMSEQGKDDLEYYLEYMASLSTNPDIDLTDPDAFAGLNGQD